MPSWWSACSWNSREQVSASGALVGNHDSTERLLVKALGKGRVDGIMEEIRGPAGRTTWDKLGNVSEEILANFLKNEYPQTIAVVLSKIKADHAARVLMNLPEDLSLEVIMRMISMESVKKDVMDGIEKTLRMEFMSNLAKRQSRDSHEMLAEIFNNFDRNAEAKFMGKLEERSTESRRARARTDVHLRRSAQDRCAGIQTLLRGVDKDKLAIALKGASDTHQGPVLQQYVGTRRENSQRRYGIHGAGAHQGCRRGADGYRHHRQGPRRQRRNRHRRR